MQTDSLTLDPPGTIAIVGAGPLGIEAALYARYLGYDVVLIEADSPASSLADCHDQPLPMLPDRCLSPLAISALEAQSVGSGPLTLPVTIGQWVNEALVPLTQSDLLRGRLRAPCRVTRIDQIPVDVESDPADANDDESEIPPDFRLTLSCRSEQTGSGQTAKREKGVRPLLPGTGPSGAPHQRGRTPFSPEQISTLDVEAVILATGQAGEIERTFDLPTDYFFQIGKAGDDSFALQGTAPGGETQIPNQEQQLREGRRQIVGIFAQLSGNPQLDLYRPRRS